MSFYAVHTGINRGIYCTWSECEKQIVGFKGAKFKKFDNRQEAENFVNGIVSVPTSATNISKTPIDPSTTIYGDGGYNSTTKPDAWGSVVNGYGNDLIGYYSHLLLDMPLKEVFLPRGIGKRIIIIANFSGISFQQNNGAELLACVAALRISLDLISKGIPVRTVYCDSQVILYWSIRLKSKNNFDPRKVAYINELIQLRKQFEQKGSSLSKVDTIKNLADLGWH